MSIVWKYFDKTGAFVQCKLCAKQLTHNSSSTGSMMNHLKLVHPTVSLKMDQDTQPKITTFASFTKHCDKKRTDTITNLIVEMIIKDLVPIKVVEHDGFIALLKYLEPGYVIPTRKTISAHISRIYDREKDNVVKTLTEQTKEFGPNISITTDCWTSPKSESFITVTAHCISPDWEMQNLVLCTRYLQVSHTAENLRIALQEISRELEIQNKILACVHDNAANITLAVKECEEIITSLGCTAHTIQLCVNKSLDKSRLITNGIAAASRLVAHVKRSNKATAALVEKQQQFNLPSHRLIQSCVTRWNSTYSMCERLVEQRWAVSALLSDRNITKNTDARTLELSDQQWHMLEELIVCLKPMKLATEALSKEKTVSLSAVGSIFSALVNDHLKAADEDSTTIAELKQNIASEIVRRFPSIFRPLQNEVDCLQVAAFLDPRHKRASFLDEINKKRVVDVVQQKMVFYSPETDNNVGHSEPPVEKKKRCDNPLAELLGPSYSAVHADDVDGDTLMNRELGQYNDMLPISLDKDPLIWWKERVDMFPNLSRVARAYLAIPATSVPSERLFSAAGRLVSKQRNCSRSKNIDSILFLQNNLKGALK